MSIGTQLEELAEQVKELTAQNEQLSADLATAQARCAELESAEISEEAKAELAKFVDYITTEGSRIASVLS